MGLGVGAKTLGLEVSEGVEGVVGGLKIPIAALIVAFFPMIASTIFDYLTPDAILIA